MNPAVLLALVLAGAFVLGAIPFGYLAGRMRGVDLRAHGSGNIGATNTLRVLGVGPGLVVLLFDVLKGLVPVLIAKGLPALPGTEDGWPSAGAGLAAILGHTFSPFLRFKGGKGVATSLGVLIGLSPVVAGLSVALFLLVVAATRYVSLGSMVGAVAQSALFFAPLAPGGKDFPLAFRLFGLLVAAFVLAKHRANIDRLRNRTESRLGQKKRGDSAAPRDTSKEVP